MKASLQRFERQETRVIQQDYWLDLPGLDREREPWPLVLFLHGAGERGDVNRVRRHGPPKRIDAGTQFPFVTVSPSCPADQWWEPEPLRLLVEDICDRFPIDRRRIYGTGLSMGGFGIWAMAVTYPDLFAAIAPICGGGSPYVAYRIVDLPVWAFHGDKDRVVPLYESQRMIDALHEFGAERATLTVYPEADHDVWTRVYDSPELYDWLLQHRRGD